MRAVGLKVLKNKLSEYVRLAAGGEVVLAADRDRVVADAVRQGWLAPPTLISAEPPPRRPVAPLADLMVELDAAREDG